MKAKLFSYLIIVLLLSQLALASTAMKEVATDEIGLFTGGSEVVRINSSGAVGIGTTTPTEKLEIANGNLLIERTEPRLMFNESDASSNNHLWYIYSVGEILRIQAINDTGSGGGTLIDIGRDKRQLTYMQVGDSSTPAIYANMTNDLVGIGTTNPTHTLHVVGSANITGTLHTGSFTLDEVAGNNLTIGGARNSSIDSPTFYVDATNNRVGIGLTSPNATLHVNGSKADLVVTSEGELKLIGDDVGAAAKTDLTLRVGANNAIGPNLIFQAADGVGGEAATANDELGTIQFQGGTGSAFAESAHIQAIASGLFSASSLPTDLLFSTTPSSSTTVTERMRIDSNGNVGIKIPSPTATLHVNSSNVDGAFAIENTTGSSLFFVNGSNGNVGIGTATPGTTLDLASDFNKDTQLRLTGGPISSKNAQIILRGALGTAATPAAVQSGNNLGWVSWQGYDGNSFSGAAEISVYAAQNASDGNVSADMAFFTENMSGSYAEKVRFTANGSVGIGTSNPRGTLHIREAATGTISPNTNYDTLVLESNTAGINIFSDSSNSGWVVFGDQSSPTQGVIRYNHNSDSFALYTNNAETVRIDSDGDVGIGDAAPASGYSGAPVLNINGTRPAIRFDASEGGQTGVEIYVNSTGMFFEHANAARDFVFLPTGSVGINTSSPSHKLHVVGSANVTGTIYAGTISLDEVAGNNLTIGGTRNSSIDGTTLYVDATNNKVGIGTSSPTAKLHMIRNVNDSASTLTLRNTNTGTGARTGVQFQGPTSGHTLVFNMGPISNPFTEMKHSGGVLSIFTQDEQQLRMGTNASTNLAIATNGNVGIGTTNPGSILHVNNSGALSQAIIESGAGWASRVTVRNDDAKELDFNIFSPTHGQTAFGLSTNSVASITTTQNLTIGTTASSNGNIILGTNNAERMRIDSSGNIGMGTTSPSARLEVVGELHIDTGTPVIRYYNGTGSELATTRVDSKQFRIETQSAPRLVINSTGEVGIGTTNPAELLHVNGSDIIRSRIESSNNDAFLEIISGTTAQSLVLFGDTGANRGSIAVDDKDNMYFETTAAQTERVFINGSSGRVGIGTTSPGALLVANNSQASGVEIRVSNSLSHGSARAMFSMYGTEGTGYEEKGVLEYNAGAGEIRLTATQPGDDLSIGAGGRVNDMFIKSDGKVGINTTSPSHTLHVVGDANVTGTLHTGAFTLDEVAGNNLTIGGARNSSIDGTTLYIDATNNRVGMRTTSPTDTLTINTGGIRMNSGGGLDMSGGGSWIGSGNLAITPSSNGNITLDSGTLFVDAVNNRVGIGTTSPNNSLHVEGSGSTYIRMTRTGGPAHSLLIGSEGTANTIYSTGATDSDHAVLRFYSSVNTERMRIDSLGNVGIGTASPTATLHVNSSSVNGSLLIQNTSGSTQLFVNSTSGRVGIGTPSPTERLEVNGNIAINATGTTRTILTYGGSGAEFGSANSSHIYLTTTGSRRARVSNVGSVSIGNSYSVGVDPGANDLIVEGNVGVGTPNPTATLHVNSSSVDGSLLVQNTTGDALLFVNGSSGKVGMGTSSPNAQLHIQTTESADVDQGVVVEGASNEEWAFMAGIIGQTSTGASIYDRNNNKVRMAFRNDGTVGVGNRNPSTPLDVLINDSATSTVTDVLALAHASTGTTANGFGSGLLFEVERIVDGQVIEGGTIDVVISDSTDHTDMVFSTRGGAGSVAEQVRIDAGGNVGINTSSPSHALHVLGDVNVTGIVHAGTLSLDEVAGNNLTISGTRNSSIDGSTFFVDATNDGVGIGTTDPQTYRLRVVQDSTENNIASFESSNAGQANIGITPTATGGLSWTLAATANAATAGPGLFIVSQSGTNYFAINGSNGNVGVGTTDPSAQLTLPQDTELRWETGGNVRAGIIGASSNVLKFFAGTAGNERMRLNGSGELGIGTQGPQELLHVNSSSDPTVRIESDTSTNTIDPTLEFKVEGNLRGQIGIDHSISGDPVRIVYGGGDLSADGSGITISSTDSVGIGSSNPIATLHVNSSNVDGSMHVQNTTGSSLLFVNGSSGFVGIGTAAPALQLSVGSTYNGMGTDSNSNFVVRQAESSSSSAVLQSEGDVWINMDTSSNSANKLVIGRDGSTISATPIITVLDTDNVGIGITSPSATLHVNSSNVDGAFAIENGSGTSIMFVNGSSRRVGIGTASPALQTGSTSAMLEIEGATNPLIAIENTGNSQQWAWYVDSDGNFVGFDATNTLNAFIIENSTGKVGIGTTTPNAALHVVNSSAGIYSPALQLSNAITQSGTGTGIDFSTSSNLSLVGSRILSETLGGNVDGNLAFLTKVDNAALTEKMRIDSEGKVGIGTTTPGELLVLQSSSSPRIVLNSTVTSSEPAIGIGDVPTPASGEAAALDIVTSEGRRMSIHASDASGDPEWQIYTENGGHEFRIGQGGNGYLTFYTAGSEKMRVMNDTGNVGIGTTSPAALLHLEGTEPYLRFNDTAGGDGLELRMDSGGVLGFRNVDDGETYMVLDSIGNVGIGTTSPSDDIHINASGATIRIVASNNGGTSEIKLYADQATDNADLRTIQVIDGGTMHFTSFATGTWVNQMVINASGSVGIGITPTAKLHVNDTSIDGVLLRVQDSDGTCDQNPESGVNTWSCTSDARLKENIRDANPVLNKLMKFQIRDFTVKASGDERTGVIAQEVQENFPETITQTEEGILMVEQPNPWELLKAIQELKLENDGLRERVELLEAKT